MDPVDATQPTVAMEPVNGTEPCPHCGSPLALDQRYCLECGAPRTYLSGMLLERLRSPSGQDSTAQPQFSPTGLPARGAGTLPSAQSSTWPRNNVLTLIAGVGVLLLAMGVGVLIGRSGGQSSAASPAPQVITVGGAASGAANTATTPTVPAETPAAAKSGAAPAAAAKHKAKAEESSGTGSSPSKPAPATVLKNLHSGSQQEREQKSKNLPNVVSTG